MFYWGLGIGYFIGMCITVVIIAFGGLLKERREKVMLEKEARENER